MTPQNNTHLEERSEKHGEEYEVGNIQRDGIF